MLAELTSLRVHVPIATEALACNRNLVRQSQVEMVDGTETLVIELDARRHDWHRLLGLSRRKTSIRWENVRTVEVRELSTLLWPIHYRVTVGDGWYWAEGRKRYFGVEEHLRGIDLRRGVTTLALRAAVLLSVCGGVGLRQVCWLLGMLFHFDVSKSALDRWIEEAASHLPDAQAMAKLLLADKPVAEAHFDEIFPRGRKGPVLVVRDEHGRILVAEEVEHRDTDHVVPFLEKLKSWGFSFQRFYIDHCAAYAEAIGKVFPNAHIQYDYFHILQNVWRTLWRAFVAHRKSFQRRSKQSDTPWYRAKLEAIATRLWEKRGLLFTADEHLSDQQRAELGDIVAGDSFLQTVRCFLGRVRGIFTGSAGELGARQRLGRLKQLAARQKSSVFGKVVKFLDSKFDQMITFLRVEGVRRNSLAETGMRSLRRLEQGHDGFRTAEARDRYLRLFQAIRYRRWSVHRRDGTLELPAAA